MSNRRYNQFNYSHEAKPVMVSLRFDGGGNGQNLVALDYKQSVTKTGANTAVAMGSAGFRGIKSITRVGDGEYTITFQDNFYRLLGVEVAVYSKDNSTAPVANAFYIKGMDLGASGGATITIRTFLGTIGSLVAPATNDRWFMTFRFSDSTA